MTKEFSRFGGSDLILQVVHSMNNGMSRDEYDSVKDKLIAPGDSVGALIQAEIDIGQFKWEGDKLVRNLNGMELNFDELTESKLRERAREMDISPTALVMLLIRKGLED